MSNVSAREFAEALKKAIAQRQYQVRIISTSDFSTRGVHAELRRGTETVRLPISTSRKTVQSRGNFN